MKNLDVERKVTISAHFTADDWGIGSLANGDDVAVKLNEQLEFLVNSGFTKEQVSTRMKDFMKKDAWTGSWWTGYHLGDVLREIYGA